MPDSKITNGPNGRSRNATIAQTGDGLPNDSSSPISVDEAEVERVRRKLTGGSIEEQIATDNDRAQKGSA